MDDVSSSGSAVLSAEELASARASLAGASAEALMRWAVERFGGASLRLASSMGAEDVVLIDLLSRIELPQARQVRVFMLDTGRLHQETYDVVDRLRGRYGDRVRIEVYFPRHEALEALVSAEGPNSFYDSIEARKACCGVRKLEPLRRALAGASGWITGLRREQSVTRAETSAIELDPSHGGIVKLNPLVDWTEAQVWAHIRQHHVPYNALHDQDYPSIGCAPCTRAVAPGEDVRAGRWWWENPELRECGLHTAREKNASTSAPSQEHAS